MAKEEKNKTSIPFNAEQMEIINQMISQVKESSSRNGADAVSVYNTRDPKSIESVNVRQINGKFVIGFKNLQQNKFKNTPLWLTYKDDKIRGLTREPFITLILSENGKDKEELEMMLVDYVTTRDTFKAKCINVEVKEIVEDHGVLGSTGEYAVSVDDKGLPTSRPSVLAQTKREERVFTVELPGFESPVEFISDFLA